MITPRSVGNPPFFRDRHYHAHFRVVVIADALPRRRVQLPDARAARAHRRLGDDRRVYVSQIGVGRFSYATKFSIVIKSSDYICISWREGMLKKSCIAGCFWLRCITIQIVWGETESYHCSIHVDYRYRTGTTTKTSPLDSTTSSDCVLRTAQNESTRPGK